MRTALVTGGAGFIGSHLVGALLRQGHRVIAYDNLLLGKRILLKPYQGHPRFQFIVADVLNRGALARAMRHGCDTVYHLSANSDIPAGTADPRVDVRQGTLATLAVLEAMQRAKVRRLVFASSSAIYGERGTRPIREDDGPNFPISFYGASKLACEGLIASFVHRDRMQAWMFRFGNVIGEHATHGAAYDFVRQLQRNPKRLRILGNGRQAKPYVYVGDIVDGMQFGVRHGRAPLNYYHLTSRGATSVRDIAQEVIRAMGVRGVSLATSGGSRGWPGDVPQVRLDGSKMARLGWRPRFTSDGAVRVGVARMVAEQCKR